MEENEEIANTEGVDEPLEESSNTNGTQPESASNITDKSPEDDDATKSSS